MFSLCLSQNILNNAYGFSHVDVCHIRFESEERFSCDKCIFLSYLNYLKVNVVSCIKHV